MNFETEKLTESFRKNLERGRAGAVGIGIFAGIFNEGRILLRRRMEKGSLIYNGDLSGKWELPGGGVELTDFAEGYQTSIISCLKNELREEVCLYLPEISKQLIMLPAWLGKEDNIDLAFVVPFDMSELQFSNEPGSYFSSYAHGVENNTIGFFNKKEIESLEIISSRMRFMIEELFEFMLNKICS
ncbi:MAG: hypothetical protein WC472_01720 [Candidatus Paceibacterota bacterium]